MQTNMPSAITLADGAGHTFFERQVEVRERLPHRADADRHLVIGSQPSAQLSNRGIRICRHAGPDRLMQASQLRCPMAALWQCCAYSGSLPS
jgi:hypothetical protein